MLGMLDQALRKIPPYRAVRDSWRVKELLGFERTLWSRRQSEIEVRKLIRPLGPERLSALEISGKVWSEYGFGRYESVDYPAFDICTDRLDRTFDLIIAEHVFEHLLRPDLAVANVLAMLNPGGHLLVITPFLYKVHPCPNDCYRWTRQGMEQFLRVAGFTDPDGIVTDSWGNRQCLRAVFRKEYILFNRYLHTVRNEPSFPLIVWALARKPRG